MSGIAGIVALDGAPVDAALLDRMAGVLASRAPDGTAARADGAIGLAHALLRTGDVGGDVPQPLSLDGRTWIVADARIDGRGELVRALRAGGTDARADAPAAELLLHAWRLWGDGCPAHLLGDFAFALWDGERRRLFCARDPFGVKPLYYAATPRAFVFSSSLDCVRLHPDVPAALDEGWIADFLVHGEAQSTDATVYAAIRQLPPAHLLVVEDGRVSLRRWWSLPDDPEPLRLRDPWEYAERFFHALREAVADRLPRERAGILMSGGRDSTGLAAAWRDLVDDGTRATDLQGFTAYHARLMPDEEPAYTSLAAEALRLTVHYLAVDDYAPFARWEEPALHRPQPTASPLLAIEADQYRQAAAHGRVLLTGQGGDALLRESRSRLAKLAAQGRLLRAARESVEYARLHRRLPRPGVRTWLAERRSGPYRSTAAVPRWISPAFAARVGLAERVAAWNARPFPAHPLRPEAAAHLSGTLWPALFGVWDPGATGIAMEVRHPYFDLRLVGLALSIPPAQWYNDKGLLRIAMRGRLPARLLARPKTPLADDPLAARLRVLGRGWLGGRSAAPNVAPWVELARVPALAGGASAQPPHALSADLRPLALSLWLSRTGG
ncbi:MAG TPA: asparagine synthase-related protein [Longimicrobium sp.]|nr:asparagine synthase-related protein [Longimicrobium sp.]